MKAISHYPKKLFSTSLKLYGKGLSKTVVGVKAASHYPKKLFSTSLKLYGEGLSKTVAIVVVIIICLLVYSATGPIDGFLKRHVPEQYHFAEMGTVFLFGVLPLLMLLLSRIGLFKLFNLLFRRVPFLNFLFRKKGTQEGIPVVAKEENGLVYGFLRGRSIIYDNTGFVKNGLVWWSVFIPSSPLPATSLKPKDFRPENVREIQLISQPGRNHAIAAIISKCINLGESLGDIRLKVIEQAEVDKMPVLSEKDKKQQKGTE